MAARKSKQHHPRKKSKPDTKRNPKRDTGRPGAAQGRVDVTGIMPEGIRIDPDITEGHPGYEESGSSEITPTPPGQRQE
jgi:hypothetical protein